MLSASIPSYEDDEKDKTNKGKKQTPATVDRKMTGGEQILDFLT